MISPCSSRSGTLPRAERPSVPLVDVAYLVPGECGAGVGRDVFADTAGFRVRPADAVLVHHDDVARAGRLPYLLGAALDRAVRTGRRRDLSARATAGLRGRGLGDGQRTVHRPVVELVAERARGRRP